MASILFFCNCGNKVEVELDEGKIECRECGKILVRYFDAQADTYRIFSEE